MGFLRRLLGGERRPNEARDTDKADVAERPDPAAPDDERARDRELLRADAERLNDPLLQRQMRYADRSWTPPAQGGERRADDEGAPET